LLNYLGERAVPGVEEYADGVYRRALALPHGSAVVGITDGGTESGFAGSLPPGRGYVRCEISLEDLRDLNAAVERCRRLLDLDADPQAVDSLLSTDPLLSPLVARSPGRRIPGCADPHELALRVVLGTRLEIRRARIAAARMVALYGKPLTARVGGITHNFPSAASLAGAHARDLPIPQPGRHSLLTLASALANGDITLDAGTDRDEVGGQLAGLPGIGPAAVARIKMQALGDPDVFIAGSAGLTQRRAQAWRPWRSYAMQYLSWAPSHVR
jgi:AraC family transcriptional regulator of adaptative response / DNA-3-methyladenine glycosylase II